MTLARIAAAIVFLLAAPALAQSEGDRQAVTDRIAAFEADFAEGDMAGVLDVMPPSLLQAMADQFGMEPDMLRTAMAQAVEGAMAEVELNAFGMDVEAATFGETAEGRAYALVPTMSEMTVPDVGTMRSENTTLMLEEDGAWYMLRIDQPQQIALVREVYPDLAEVPLQLGTTEIVE
ncbi:hypothetical protein [Jannaschia sp. LMIT008]|uniref:hypothetical protein n=1 Tax=Jannaschia maritima TaxID=3032585 RepID=UPI002811370A|nr:hypothetical protein [Jannaschia sp. LMIT008]